MDNEKEQSLKQRAMLNAYQQSKRDIDWPTLECAMLMIRFAKSTVTKVYAAKTPTNTPIG